MADYFVSLLIGKVIARSKASSFSRDLIRSYLQDSQDGVLGRHGFPFTEDRLVVTLPAGSTTFAYDTGHEEILQVVLSSVTSPVTPSQP